jgi:hypothetical protein
MRSATVGLQCSNYYTEEAGIELLATIDEQSPMLRAVLIRGLAVGVKFMAGKADTISSARTLILKSLLVPSRSRSLRRWRLVAPCH